MNLRKCQAINAIGEVEFEGLFHGFGTCEGETIMLIERENEVLVWWRYDVKFLEPARQRVEVTVNDKPTQTGCLVGWYQYGNGDVSGPAALVLHDDGKHRIYDETQVRIIKEVENE